jgi:hypothetical protein
MENNEELDQHTHKSHDDDDYELEGCPYRHDCNGAGNFMGWCILASGHDGPCFCGRCGDTF